MKAKLPPAISSEKELTIIKKVLQEFISGKWKGWTVFPTTKVYPQKYFVKEKYLPKYAKAIKELSKKEGADVKFFQMSKEFLACKKLYTNNSGLYRIMPGDAYWQYSERVYKVIWADDKTYKEKKKTTKDFRQYICMLPPDTLKRLKGELKQEIYNDMRKMAHGLIDKVFDEFCKSSKVEAIKENSMPIKSVSSTPAIKESLKQAIDSKEEYLTTEEFASHIKCSPRTVYNQYKKKLVINEHYIKPLPKKILFKNTAIKAWMGEKETVSERPFDTTNNKFKGTAHTDHLLKKLKKC